MLRSVDVEHLDASLTGDEDSGAGEHPARWTVDDVADYLRVPAKTIYKWRLTGDGPVGARIGKHLRYDPADVVAWFESQKHAA